MKPFSEHMRHEYPLTPDSLVVEIGCHAGAFAKTIAEKYGCRVLTFEPVKQFADKAIALFAENGLGERVRVETCGIARESGKATFRIHGELTGAYAGGEPVEVELIAAPLIFAHPWIEQAMEKQGSLAALSINAEGAEYEILESLLDEGRMGFFDHLQIQFHSVALGAASRRESIRQRLRITHRPSWEIPQAMDNTWDGWEATA